METIRISFEITENDNQEQIKKVLKALGVRSIKTEKTISPTLTKKIEKSRKDDEKAVGLYRKFGFEEVNVRKDYYGKDKDALCMTRGLVNVEKEDISD